MNMLTTSRTTLTVLFCTSALVLSGCAAEDGKSSSPTSELSTASVTPGAASTTASSQFATSPSASSSQETGADPSATSSSQTNKPADQQSSSPASAQGADPAASGAAAGTPICDYGQVHIRAEVADGAGAAGSRYINLTFTNSGSTACSMSGYPDVIYVDGSGQQIGAAASHAAEWTSSGKVLAAGESIGATLRETRASLYEAQLCQPTTAAGYQLTIPGTSHSLTLHFPAEACSNSGITQLSVGQVGAVA